RIGSSRYEEENGSYGLTTLHCEHAEVDGKTVRLTFPAKSHKVWDSTIRDKDLARTIRELKQRAPGERLLAYEHDREWRPITPHDVNRYLRRRTGGRFSAKDFRTLRGTVTAAASLAKHGPEDAESKRKKAVAKAMKDAA